MEIKAKKLNTLFERTSGLMFLKNPETVYLETRFGIHTFFMKTPIDVIVMDSNNSIKDIKRGMKPWRVFFWNPIYDRVLECPSDSNLAQRLKVGDKITINFN